VLENIIAKNDIKPCFVVFQVDSYEASNKYIAGKKRDAEELGVELKHIVLDSAKVTQEEFESAIEKEGMDENCHGIIIQLPIPNKYNVVKLQNKIPREKDVDGFTRRAHLPPCTPSGIMTLLDYYKGKNWLEGKNAVVIGRSHIVGKPMATLLTDRNATVTICHSKTQNMAAFTKNADLVVVAAGKAKLLTRDMVKPGATIIDVGINRINGKLYGDADFENLNEICDITPVPGGIGPMTVATLVSRLVVLDKLAKKQQEAKQERVF